MPIIPPYTLKLKKKKSLNSKDLLYLAQTKKITGS